MTTDTQRQLQQQLAHAARELDDGRNQREITTRAVDQAAGAVHDGIADQWQKIATMLRRRAEDRADKIPVAWNEESEAELSANAAIGGLFAGATSTLAGTPAPRRADRYQVGRAPRDDPHPFLPQEDEDPDPGWTR